MPRTWAFTPVHDRPCIPRPADRVEQETAARRDLPDRVVARVQHPPAAVRRLRDGPVAGAEPAVVGVEDRVARPAPPRPVEPARADDAHCVLAVRPAAEIPRVEEVVPALAADDLRALDHAAFPAAARCGEDLAPHAGQRGAVLRQRLDPDHGRDALRVAVFLPDEERPAGAVARDARIDRARWLADQWALILIRPDRAVR